MDWRPLPWSLLWRINEFPRPIPLMIRWCALKLLTHFIAFRSVSLEAKTQINSSSSSELELHTFHISSAVFVLLNNVAIFGICVMIKQEFAYYGFRVFEVLLPAVRVFIQSIRKFLSRSAFTPSCSQAVGGRLIRPAMSMSVVDCWEELGTTMFNQQQSSSHQQQLDQLDHDPI